MRNRELLMMASVLALLRGEVTIRGIAERFGVTEAQVARWRDVFEIAGMLALSDLLSSKQPSPKKTPRRKSKAVQGAEPTTHDFADPTTHGAEYSTTPETTTTEEPTTTTTAEPVTTTAERQS